MSGVNENLILYPFDIKFLEGTNVLLFLQFNGAKNNG
jgi:hypothetical protein